MKKRNGYVEALRGLLIIVGIMWVTTWVLSMFGRVVDAL